jgi:hypothetical protein
MTYRILLDTEFFLPVAVSSKGLLKSPCVRLNGAEEYSLLLLLLRAGYLWSDPTTYRNRDLHAEVPAQKAQ